MLCIHVYSRLYIKWAKEPELPQIPDSCGRGADQSDRQPVVT